MNLGRNAITSDDFVLLFVALLQSRFIARGTSNNFLEEDWHFSLEKLNRFIYFSKNDSTYKDFLRDFSFRSDGVKIYSLELIVAINRARHKHIITAFDGDFCYISRHYFCSSVMETYKDYVLPINMFVDAYLDYERDPDGYEMSLVSNEVLDNQMMDFNERNIFNLKRGLRANRARMLDDRYKGEN